MRRGDMIFYGPNASQHVAMYLGDGQMLEAPYTGSVVKISPVRTSGMTPYVTRTSNTDGDCSCVRKLVRSSVLRRCWCALA